MRGRSSGVWSLPVLLVALFVGVLFFFLVMYNSTSGVDISSNKSYANYSVYAGPYELLNTVFSTSMYIWIGVAVLLALLFLLGVFGLASRAASGRR